MQENIIQIAGKALRVYSFHTVVVGSGAAGFNAAGRLHALGHTDVAMVTEGLQMGTSRNTGSDKQTYYRMTLSGSEADSVAQMAQNLFAGGCVDGDLALCEAACSTRCFYHLLELGVPFPQDRYGAYTGYKTDHDPSRRGASAGPLTSRYMTEALQKDVLSRGIPIFDRCQVIEILTAPQGEGRRAVGLLALDLAHPEEEAARYVLFCANNIVYATGGEAGMYATSVYPGSQTGGTGAALRAGVRGKNLTESQYGIASIRFRWNLSGSYQQVIPRYFSTDQNGGEEREFLDEAFPSPGELLDSIFLKGYQWPFDPRRLGSGGSSRIDLMVYQETVLRGRRVFLDFRRNPACSERGGRFDPSLLGPEAQNYLRQCGCLQDTPLQRLACMNEPAIELYREHGIDLSREPLEIALCAQHNNGGLAGNLWWESNLSHFFPVGEVNGSHGVYRPGGSALNAGQVGSLRASQYIAQNYPQPPLALPEFAAAVQEQVAAALSLGERWLSASSLPCFEPGAERRALGERMSRYGAAIRSLPGVQCALGQAERQLETLLSHRRAATPGALPLLFRCRDLLVSQITYLSAIEDYILQGGGSRGSALVCLPGEDRQAAAPGMDLLLDEPLCFRLDDGAFSNQIQETLYTPQGCRFFWRPVRPLPQPEDWFETVWRDFREGRTIR